MATYTSLIYLDINGSDNHTAVVAKQGDKNSRKIRIELTEDGQGISVPNGDITLRGKTSNGYSIFNNVEVSSDKEYITATLSEQVLLTQGTVTADIAIYDGDTVLSTSAFEIKVVEQPYNPDNIMDNDEVNALNTLIERLSQIENNATVVESMLSRVAEIEDLDDFIAETRLVVSPNITIAFDANEKPIYISSETSFGGGVFYQNAKDAVSIYIANTVTNLSGALSGLNDLTTVYINDEALLENSGINESVVIKGTDEFHAVNQLEIVAKNIPTKTSDLTNDNEYINLDNIVFRGSFNVNNPMFCRMQKEGSNLVIYPVAAFSDTPSDKTTYSGNDLLSHFAGIIKTVTGNGFLHLPDTADSSAISVITDSDYTIKNKNVYEYSTDMRIINCSLSIINNSYEITPRTSNFYIGGNTSEGVAYNREVTGHLYKLAPCTISWDNSFFNKILINFYDENYISLGWNNYTTSGFQLIGNEKQNAKYFTIRIGKDSTEEALLNIPYVVSIQVEYGTEATPIVEPLSNSQGILYEGGSTIICDDDFTLKYVPKLY